MRSVPRLLRSEPLWIIAAAWPAVLLAPLLPGLPKVWPAAFSWRQELTLALALALTLGLLKRLQTSVSQPRLATNEFLFLLPLSVYVVWGATSGLWAQSSMPVLHYVFTWVAYFVFFVLISRITEKPKLLGASLAILAIVVSIISIAAAIEFWSSTPEFFQYSLLIRRSVGLGEPLAISIPLFASLAIHLTRLRAALLFGTAAVLAWMATLQSLERAPTIGALVGLTLLFATLLRRRWRPRKITQAMLLGVALISVTALQSLPKGGSSVGRLTVVPHTDPNGRVRLLVWAIGAEMLREHPWQGVGANNYEIAYPEARKNYSARNANSAFVGLYDDLLAQRAHNEYVQILAELGITGFVLFFLCCLALLRCVLIVLRSTRSPLALGAVCSLIVFALSSGASSVSFRWLSSGLLFFFASAIVIRFSTRVNRRDNINLTPFHQRTAMAVGFVFALAMVGSMSIVGASSVLRGVALDGSATDSSSTERLFAMALLVNPYDGPAHFDFGAWLYGKRRFKEAVPHLRFATAHGLNSSICYAFLAGAEAAGGDTAAAERTTAKGVAVYPRSVFLRVRHSIALAEIGMTREAAQEYKIAMTIDAPAARGWRQLMCFGPRAADRAAKGDPLITAPRLLNPGSWADPAIAEQATRPPRAYPDDLSSGMN